MQFRAWSNPQPRLSRTQTASTNSTHRLVFHLAIALNVFTSVAFSRFTDNPNTQFLTETDSNGVITGQPVVGTSQPATATIPPLGTGTQTVTVGGTTYTLAIEGSTTILLSGTSTSTPSQNTGSSSVSSQLASKISSGSTPPDSINTSPISSTSNSATPGTSSGLGVGAGVGIGIGSIVALVLLGFLVYFQIHRSRSRRKERTQSNLQANEFEKPELNGKPLTARKALVELDSQRIHQVPQEDTRPPLELQA